MKKTLFHTSLLLLLAGGAVRAQEPGSAERGRTLPAGDAVVLDAAAERGSGESAPSVRNGLSAGDGAAVSAYVSDMSALALDSVAGLSDSGESVSPGGMRLKRRFLPTSRRIDREINKGRFVYKGETMLGLTISYGTLTSDDADMFPVFEGINLDGNILTVNPFVGYFYRDNNCFGVRFGYSRLSGTLDTFGVNLGDQNDLALDVPWLDMSSERFSLSLFHRSYVPLDERGRFGVFAELELSFSSGDNAFAYKSGEQVRFTNSENRTFKAWFNPGVAVYAFPNICATLSFGLGGLKYASIRQFDDQGNEIGSRRHSTMKFRLNLADIRVGMTVHLWNKKKQTRG